MSTPGQNRRVTISEQDAVQSEYGLSLEARVSEPEATDLHPAVLQVSLANRSEEVRSVRANDQPPLPSTESTERNPRITLVPRGRPASDPHPVPIALGCWQLAEPVGEVLARDTGRIEPGGSRTRECTVWGAVDNDEPCLPAGTFRFEGTYDGTETGTRPALRWGFTLAIEETETRPDER